MLWLYCLPGRLFAELGFLWHGKGGVTGSARRRESRLAHFIYATIFWLILAFFLSAKFADPADRRASAVATEHRNEKQPDLAKGASQPEERVFDDVKKTDMESSPEVVPDIQAEESGSQDGEQLPMLVSNDEGGDF